MNKESFKQWAQDRIYQNGKNNEAVASNVVKKAAEVKVFDKTAGSLYEAIGGHYGEISKLEAELSAYVKTRLDK